MNQWKRLLLPVLAIVFSLPIAIVASIPVTIVFCLLAGFSREDIDGAMGLAGFIIGPFIMCVVVAWSCFDFFVQLTSFFKNSWARRLVLFIAFSVTLYMLLDVNRLGAVLMPGLGIFEWFVNNFIMAGWGLFVVMAITVLGIYYVWWRSRKE